MAEVIIPDNCGLATSIWTMAGKTNPVTTTVGIHISADLDPTDVLGEYYNGWVISGGMCHPAQMGTVWTFEGCTMLYNEGGGVMVGVSAGTPTAGTVSAPQQMIVSSAALVQKRTARAGRHFRGRHYIPLLEVEEGSINAMGQIDSLQVTNLRSRMGITADFWADSVGWETVLLHASEDITPGFTPITSFTVAAKTATQRRRLRS